MLVSGDTTIVSTSGFAELDEKPLSRFHVIAMLTTGMGVFTDGYDLSSIGLVLPQCLASFGVDRITGLQSGLLTGAALVGSVIGALLAGWLAQKGRKRYYGIDVGDHGCCRGGPGVRAESVDVDRDPLRVGHRRRRRLRAVADDHGRARERGEDRGKKLGFGFGAMWNFGAISAALVLLLLRCRRCQRRSAMAHRARVRRRPRRVGTDAASPHAGDCAFSRASRGRYAEGTRGSGGHHRCACRGCAARGYATMARAVREARARRSLDMRTGDALQNLALLRIALDSRENAQSPACGGFGHCRHGGERRQTRARCAIADRC